MRHPTSFSFVSFGHPVDEQLELHVAVWRAGHALEGPVVHAKELS